MNLVYLRNSIAGDAIVILRLSLRALFAVCFALVPIVASAGLLPVSNGLVLNFQADNIDGQNNATLADGQDIDTWRDIVQAGGNTNANDATHQGAKDYLNPSSTTTGMPNYVAVSGNGGPGVRFTRLTGPNGDALGFNSTINGLLNNNAMTAFVVGDFDVDPVLNATQPYRFLQIGHRNGSNNSVVGLGNRGFRFNGSEKTFATPAHDQETAVKPTIARYVMDFSQPYGTAGTNARYWMDGVEATAVTTISNPTTSLGANWSNHGFSIGAGQNNASSVIDSIHGTMYALIVYNRILSDLEIEQVENYLQRYVPEPSGIVLVGAATALATCCGRRRSIDKKWF